MSFSNEGKMNREEWPAKVIDTQEGFWDLLYDAKNQFIQMQFAIHSKKQTEEEIVKQNNEFQYFNFIDYIKIHNETISDRLKNNNNVQKMIGVYDDLVNRARTANSKREMEQIIEERDEFIDKYDLGIE